MSKQLVKLLLVVSSLLAIACPSKRDAESADAGAPVEVPDASVALEPFALRLTGYFSPPADGGDSSDAGATLTTIIEPNPDDPPLVPPLRELLVETSRPLRDWRLRVFDEADRVIVSDDTYEETPEGLRYRFSFPEPLKTGYAYTLMLDAQTGATAVELDGEPIPDQRLLFKIEGEKQKPPPPPKKRRRR